MNRSGTWPTRYCQGLVEGKHYIATNRIVRWLVVVFAIIFLLTVAPSFVTPLFIVRDFGPEEWKLAALEIAFSVGMVLGGIIVVSWLAKRSRMGLIMFSTGVFGALTVGMGG